MIINQNRLIGIVIVVVLLLLIPLIAMQFTDQVQWNLFDFMIAGALLMGAGLIGELVASNIKKPKHRNLVLLGLILALLLIWAELAVGIFGTPFAGS